MLGHDDMLPSFFVCVTDVWHVVQTRNGSQGLWMHRMREEVKAIKNQEGNCLSRSVRGGLILFPMKSSSCPMCKLNKILANASLCFLLSPLNTVDQCLLSSGAEKDQSYLINQQASQ